MIEKYKNKFRVIYFADSIPKHFPKKTVFDWSYCNVNRFGIRKKTRVTWVTDFNTFDSSEALLKKFSSTTRNEIRKVLKSGMAISINFNADPERVLELVDSMFKDKNIHRIHEVAEYEPENDTFWIMLKYDNINIAHAYLFDRKHSTVLLKYSASVFRSSEQEEKNKMGYLNKYLHFQEMNYFKNLGIQKMDWGGGGFLKEFESRDSSIAGIIKFKSSFGGELTKVYFYENIFTFRCLKSLMLSGIYNVKEKIVKKIKGI